MGYKTESNKQTKQKNLTDVDNSAAVTRGEGRWGEGGGRQIFGDRRLDFGW